MFIRKRKGPLFTYWQLPYRKKFYRILWMFPFAPVFLLFPDDVVYFGLSRNQLAALSFTLLVALAAYTYYRWKKSDGEEGTAPPATQPPDTE